MQDNRDNTHDPMDVDDLASHTDQSGLDSRHQPSISSNQAGTPRPSSPATGMRRARVDDEEDFENVSHNRNRPRTDTSTPTPGSHQTPPRPQLQQQRTTMQFLLSLPQQQPFAQFSIVLEASQPRDANDDDLNQTNPRTHEQQFTFDAGPISRERLAAALANLAVRFGSGVMMIPGEREPDLKRGETILKALEVIPKGLMQRMNTVGGVLGGNDSQPSSDEQMVCPVCWEPLLDDGLFGSEDQTINNPREGFSADESIDNAKDSKKSILALPCRHIFHGSCLLPWLSRQTTCPSCRFNLDPERLTSKPPPFIPLRTPAPNEPLQTNARDEAPLPNPQQNLGPNQQGQPGHPEINFFGGTPHPAGATVIGAMSMVFAADTLPPDPANRDPNNEAIPGLDSIDDPRVDDENQDPNTVPRPGVFPPGFPPDLQAFLAAMFGEGVAGNGPNPGANPDRSRDGAQVSSASTSVSTDSAFTIPSDPNAIGVSRHSGSQAQTPTSSGSSQTQPSGSSSGSGTDTGPSTQTRGIIAALLGAIFGGQNRASAPLGSGTTGTRPSSNPQPSYSDQQTQAPPASTTPSGPTLAFPLPPFHSPFPPFSNGQVQMPPLPPFSGMPRPMAPTPGGPQETGSSSTVHVGTPHAVQVPPSPLTRAPLHSVNNTPAFPFSPMVNTELRERRKWSLPEGRGESVRQRVEERERQLGLRCYDPSCGFGPTDESPSIAGDKKERVLIHKGEGHEHTCEHTFHAGCLVSAARVAGFGPEGQAAGNVEVPCIVCRTHGYVEKEAWEEGVRQLQINDN